MSTDMMQFDIYSYFEKGCRKNVHATVPKGNMGYVQYTFPDTVALKPTFVAFLQHSQTYVVCLWILFQISFKNSELNTTHKTFRGCLVHFVRQPFSKQLYMQELLPTATNSETKKHSGKNLLNSRFTFRLWQILVFLFVMTIINIQIWPGLKAKLSLINL